mmetsp:Transcript_23884/g.49766  ORF Transcript_23884/g.49766 Transcript_23884/m.49766 type:complete len:229 (-) Transcript_23884:561-1247(-)
MLESKLETGIPLLGVRVFLGGERVFFPRGGVFLVAALAPLLIYSWTNPKQFAIVLKVKLLLLSSLKRRVAIGPLLERVMDFTFFLDIDHDIVPVCPDAEISKTRVELSTRAMDGVLLEGDAPSGRTQKRLKPFPFPASSLAMLTMSPTAPNFKPGEFNVEPSNMGAAFFLVDFGGEGGFFAAIILSKAARGSLGTSETLLAAPLAAASFLVGVHGSFFTTPMDFPFFL